MRRARDEAATTFNFQHRLASGATRDVEVHWTQTEMDGRSLLFSIVHDVTDRVIAEKRLVQNLANIRSVLESAADAIFITDAAGHCEYVNPEASRMLGYTREELMSKNLFTLSAPAEQAQDRSICTRLVAAGALRVELRLARKDGTELTVDANGTVLPDGRILGALRDITAAKLAEAELMQHRDHLETLVQARTADLSLAKETAEVANRAKSMFLAKMSHELRTPMNAILGMTALARMRSTDPKQIEQLGKVDTAARHLLAIITDILDISRIEANRLPLHEGDFSLGEVIRNVDTLLRAEANAKRIALDFALAPELAAMTLRGDAQRLGQVLVNLVGNGVKFTDSGSVSVSARLDHDQGAQVALRFEVRDTGVGIAEVDHRKLFQAFEQVDGSLTRRYGGTGLGLAISKQLIQLMGGEIGVESRIGVGSRFWFTVRLGKGGGAVAPPSAPNAASVRRELLERHAGARILLAEDVTLNQEVARAVLEAGGLEVQIAVDGMRAVEMARLGHFDLILMDVQMPLMDGLEATRQIRALPNGSQVPIVAMTANVFAEDELRCRQAGMNDFLGRPAEPIVLLAMVLKWLEPQRS
jgi:PAS domain S-box-containing protein